MSGQIFLQSTPLKDIRETGILGRSLHTIYSQLSIAIKERRGKNLSMLLAEPVMQTEEGSIDWYTFGEKCQLLSELSADQQHKAKTALHQGYQELESLSEELANSDDVAVNQLGKALQAALVVPADENIYWVDNRPVLSLWGCFQCEGDLATWHSTFTDQEDDITEPPEPPPTSGSDSGLPAAVMSSHTSGRFVVIGSRFFWSVFFLSLLLLLLAFIFSLFKDNVTMPYPVPPSPSPAVSKKLDLASKTELELREKLDKLQQEIAGQRAKCTTDNAEITQRAISDTEKEAFDERMAKEQAKVGEITVTLKWNNRNDLDLHIHCPNNDTIYFKNPNGCNGDLDIDKNYENNLTKSPVENINWARGKAMPGKYQIQVKYFKRQDLDVEPVTPFQIRLHQGDQDSIFEGKIHPDEVKIISSFEVTP